MLLDRTLKRWEIALMLGVLCALLGGAWLGEDQAELATGSSASMSSPTRTVKRTRR